MEENPYQPPAGEPPSPQGAWLNRWLIALVVVAVVDVFLLVVLPGLGIAAALLTAVPVTRAYVTARRASDRGVSFHALEGLHLIFVTAALVLGATAAGAVAFGCVCTAVALSGMAFGLDRGPGGNKLMYLAFGGGGLAALAALLGVAILLWPRTRARLIDEPGLREEVLGPPAGPN